MPIIVNIATNSGIDLRWATQYARFANSTIQDGGTATEFMAVDTGAFDGVDEDLRFIVGGAGLTYGGSSPNIQVIGGTITSLTMQTEAGVTLATFTGFSIDAATFTAALDAYGAGGPGNEDPSALDAIFRALDYVVTGGSGNDLLEGGDLADVLDGGDGADRFVGGAGSDTFIGGGADGDTADYSSDALHGGTSGVRVNQHASLVQGGLAPDTAVDGFGDTDSISNVLNIIGTQFGDEIYGGTHNNRIEGGGGNDFIDGNDGNDNLIGGGGNDILVGGAGGDTLNGGNGNLDRASYITSTTGLIADLLIIANNTGDAEGDSYTGIEALEGSNFDDDLRGNDENNFLIGGAGADTLDGRGGFDYAAYLTATEGLTASLVGPGTGDAAGDVYIGIERLAGTAFDDTLIGNSGNNFLMGAGGADILDGGGGSDTADYFLATEGLTVNLGTPLGNNTGDAAGDQYISIENLRGTRFDDVLVGNAAANLLDGHFGADVLDGGDGTDYAWYNTNSTGTGVVASLANTAINTGDAEGDTYISIEGLIGSNMADHLIGDAGNNFLRGTGGADILDGGDGTDYADYFNAAGPVIADLGNPANNTGDAEGDTYISIENLRGSSFNDTLRGNEFNNTLRGGGGADVLDGGAGLDFANYADSSGSVTASLADPTNMNTGEAAGDTYISIEGLRGSNFNDTLIGNGEGNFLQGGPQGYRI